MENGLVTADGTKVLTVEEYDRFITAIPESMKAIFEINTITGLRYIELQRLYENPQWYYKARNQIILPKEDRRRKSKNSLKGQLTNCLQLSHMCFLISLMAKNRLIGLHGTRI